MKPIYECDWCSFRGIAEEVERHEQRCEYNPINIEKRENLNWMKEHCSYCFMTADRDEIYEACKLKASWCDDKCNPNVDCFQYCEGEDVWEKM